MLVNPVEALSKGILLCAINDKRMLGSVKYLQRIVLVYHHLSISDTPKTLLLYINFPYNFLEITNQDTVLKANKSFLQLLSMLQFTDVQ